MSNGSDTPKATAINIAGHIEYASGSIVSKAIVQKPTGSLTLFAFDAGQKLSEHTTPFDAVVFILDGEAELIIGGQEVIVPAGSFAIMPGNVPHAVNAIHRFKMALTMIRG
jgi:quercetin dioxygenase-like cupin family protein